MARVDLKWGVSMMLAQSLATLLVILVAILLAAAVNLLVTVAADALRRPPVRKAHSLAVQRARPQPPRVSEDIR